MTDSSKQLDLLARCLTELHAGFSSLPLHSAPTIDDRAATVLHEVAQKLHDNRPFQHPFYLGQMLKPPHPIAKLAYSLAMEINPNNHARDGGNASSDMEVECITQLAKMFGWDNSLGHLCGGGTIANFEALWVSREMTGGKTVVASSQAHYTHSRLSRVLGVPFESVSADNLGRMDLDHLESLCQIGNVGTVVATAGTTGLGAVDPVHRLLELRERYRFRLHVDAAYGGYFSLANNLRPETRAAFEAITQADSIVIDPHKHGLQPYGCGCVLFRDRRVAAVYQHQSPYTYFTPADLHLGEISLECSRAGAAAVALWATMQRFPLTAGGEFAQGLEAGRMAALQLHQWLTESSPFVPVLTPELDIVVWGIRASTSSECSRLAKTYFDKCREEQIDLALISLPREFLEAHQITIDWDDETMTCLRACLMKPEHLDWIPRIIERLDRVRRRLWEIS